jgi:hypothetical protein
MKTRQTMRGQALIQEVISQLSRRFVPRVADIRTVCSCLLLWRVVYSLSRRRESKPCSRKSTSKGYKIARKTKLHMLLDRSRRRGIKNIEIHILAVIP